MFLYTIYAHLSYSEISESHESDIKRREPRNVPGELRRWLDAKAVSLIFRVAQSVPVIKK